MELHKLHNQFGAYPHEVRKKAVLMYLIDGSSKAEIKRKFGMSIPVLNEWINKYGPELLKNKDLKFESQSLSLDYTMKKSTDNLTEQAKKIIELENLLDRANLKVSLLETMIDIAENELNIPIRKKSGPQPSKEKHKKTK
jgi:transposase